MPAVTHSFITYDDPTYVTENPHVTTGITWANLKWAFQSTEASNWHPITWLSHMADCQVFGLRPWGHHLTNVLLHALNAVLLFDVLLLMTGALWRSLLVGALFGLHPLHVESVAWIAERKDVLSTLFLLLALWAYVRRTRSSSSERTFGWGWYGLALVFFALGLMAKPMVVTLPFLLLLIDYWPLRRWKNGSLRARVLLVVEKLPFLALAAASCGVTLYAQAKGGAMATVEEFPWGVRLANALTSYCWYLEKLFVPTKLAVFYPSFATQPPLTSVLAAAAILASVTLLSLTVASRRPSFLVGWLWFLGTLVPVIGFVQIGGQSMADRYSYIPSIGILLLIVWCVPDRFAVPAWSRRLLAGLAGGLVAACGLATLHQLSYWKDGIRLFRHALAVTQDNWVAHANLAAELAKTSTSASSAEFRETVLILARFAETYNRKGVELEGDPRHLAEAIKEFRIAIQIFPGLADAHFNLGTALMKTKGDPREAVEEFRTATKLKPDYLNAHLRLAVALSRIPGGDEEAKAELRVAIGQAPNSSLAHYLLGVLLYRDAANRGEAMAELRVALFIDPDFKPAQDALRRYQGN
ncbi:MAG TPA: tetratricopeptide repeat protein [Opitutaceae bacterium]|jgi:Flp pilus assembly protein TadD